MVKAEWERRYTGPGPIHDPVFARAECVFTYCPTVHACIGVCAHPAAAETK